MLREGQASLVSGKMLGDALIGALCDMTPVLPFKTCITCKHMEADKPAFCKLHNGTPPPTVIISACAQYEDEELDDDIPF